MGTTRVPVAKLLRAAVIAGLLAGLGLGLFHLLVSEPVIERAIQLEQQQMAPGDGHEELFSRQTQRAGLIAASVVYGVALGLIFGGALAYFREHFPSLSLPASVAVLAALAVWVIAATPAIKYPANPPGVGDPATIYLRQAKYLGLILLNVLALVSAEALRRRLALVLSAKWAPLALAATLYLLFWVLLLVLVPANSDTNHLPTDLLWRFRAASLVGEVLFWSGLGAAFAYLLRPPQPLRSRPTGA